MTPATAFNDTLEQIRQGQHVSLTTYRKDGRTVATPLWFVRDGEQLIVMTAPDSGKVKRLRNNQSVVIAPLRQPGPDHRRRTEGGGDGAPDGRGGHGAGPQAYGPLARPGPARGLVRHNAAPPSPLGRHRRDQQLT
jgi:hypothetical protein